MKTSDSGGTPQGLTYERNIGLNVKRLREGRSMSLAGLAKRLSDIGEPMDAKAVSRIEDGTRRVKFNEAVALSKILEVEMDQLTLHPEVAADRATRAAWSRYVAADADERAARRALSDLMREGIGDESVLEEVVRELGRETLGPGIPASDFEAWVRLTMTKFARTPRQLSDGSFVVEGWNPNRGSRGADENE